MKVTFKKGKQDKIHISVDGEYSLTVDETYFPTLELWQGKEIDEDEFAEIKEKVNTRRCYNYAVSLLSRRDHSEGELRQKLRQKGYSDGIEEALDKLKGQGYLDDERFARMYVGELIRLKGYGKARLKRELYRKGVSREITDIILEEAEFPEDKLEKIIRRKYMRYLDDEKGVRRTVNALLRLGYSFGEIRDALKNVADEEITDE